jgi:hypothetical protein
MTEQNPRSPLDPVDAPTASPAPSEPQASVGDEGGAAPLGSPRIVETDADDDEREGETESWRREQDVD